jgi:hypothetical protein
VSATLIVVVIGIATTALLLVMLLAMIRHLKLILSSLLRFQRELGPVLEQLDRGRTEAMERVETVSHRQLGKPAGAKIRR